jgi:hypothetical protein
MQSVCQAGKVSEAIFDMWIRGSPILLQRFLPLP